MQDLEVIRHGNDTEKSDKQQGAVESVDANVDSLLVVSAVMQMTAGLEC